MKARWINSKDNDADRTESVDEIQIRSNIVIQND